MTCPTGSRCASIVSTYLNSLKHCRAQLTALTHNSLLLILTCISFVPQLYALVRRRGDASGISPIYVFINLVAATELFTISFVITVNYPEPSSSFTHDPRQLGDWINFANITVIWALWLVM